MEHSPLPPDTLLSSLNWRYATKVFNPEKTIPSDVWNAIEESLVLTPSSLGLQPWKFLVITDPAIKEQLVEHSWNQTQVRDCSHLLVLCAREKTTDDDIDAWLKTLANIRQVSLESLDGYANMIRGFIHGMDDASVLAWAKNQIYIALGQVITSAALLGIDACPMEGIVKDEYNRVLGLTNTGYTTTVACPLGYRSPDDKYANIPKARFPSDKIIDHLPPQKKH